MYKKFQDSIEIILVLWLLGQLGIVLSSQWYGTYIYTQTRQLPAVAGDYRLERFQNPAIAGWEISITQSGDCRLGIIHYSVW